MINRREILVGMGALCAANTRLAAAQSSSMLTAADVHIDGYPTVEAVRWIGWPFYLAALTVSLRVVFIPALSLWLPALLKH